MRRFNFTGILFLFLTLSFMSCDKNDYKVGGELHNPQINMTTYDYLKSNRFGLFDTLLLLVDKAGIKEKINQKGTFFAPTDFAIRSYLNARTLALQKSDPFKRWTVDSIIKYELPAFADSLDIYFVKDKFLVNSLLNSSGTIFNNNSNGEVVVSYEETSSSNLGYNDQSSLRPKIVYFTYLYQSLPVGFKVNQISYPVGVRTLVQTSNAQTLTGTLHVLQNSHTLFFFR